MDLAEFRWVIAAGPNPSRSRSSEAKRLLAICAEITTEGLILECEAKLIAADIEANVDRMMGCGQ